MPNPTAAMITIGDEILSGRTRDSNMPHLAQALAAKGIDLRETRTVPGHRRGDRRRGQRPALPLRPRLHLRRHRADARRHHRRLGRRRLRGRHRRARRRPRDPRQQLRQSRARPERGAPPDGAHPRRRRAHRQPGVEGARLQPRQRPRDGRRPVGVRGDGGGAPAAAHRRPGASLRDFPGSPPGGHHRRTAPRDRRGAPTVAIGSYPFNRDGVFGANLVARSDDPDALAAAAEALRAMAQELEARAPFGIGRCGRRLLHRRARLGGVGAARGMAEPPDESDDHQRRPGRPCRSAAPRGGGPPSGCWCRAVPSDRPRVRKT